MVVCTPELNTLRDVRECQRVFGEIIRLDMKRVCFVFNHNQPFAVLGRDQFESALEQPMNFELPHAGESAYKAANRGEPLVLAHSGSAYSKAVERMRRAVVHVDAKAAPEEPLRGDWRPRRGPQARLWWLARRTARQARELGEADKDGIASNRATALDGSFCRAGRRASWQRSRRLLKELKASRERHHLPAGRSRRCAVHRAAAVACASPRLTALGASECWRSTARRVLWRHGRADR